MKKVNIDIKEIEKIIGESVQSIEKITYGYTNEIYSINGRYILKICINERNKENFKRASLFCQKYHESINCPKVLYSCLDTDNVWQIEEQVEGENLFFKWNRLTKNEKEDVMRKICKELKKIHEIPVMDVFESNFKPEDWKNKFKKDIFKKIDSLKNKGMNFVDLYEKIKEYIAQNLEVLDKTDFRVCHTDMHFDNIMIDDDNNIKILDYDRLRISSIDYELNVFNIMSKTPELVVNDELKGLVKKEDYSELLSMIQKNYPEMFRFNYLNERLNIYALKHYLGLLGIVKEKDMVINALMEIADEKNLTKEGNVRVKER